MERVLADLPADFSLPVAIVQHRGTAASSGLTTLLQRRTHCKVKEPVDKEPIRPGHIYIAPADYHLLVDGCAFALSTDAPVLSARPSIDVLFESAADAVGPGAIGVVMTGASADGAEGAARIKAKGGILIVQDPDSAESDVMPRAALCRATPDAVLRLEDIGAALSRITKGVGE